MMFHSMRLAFLAITTLVAGGIAQAGSPSTAAEADPCVVYPYYGRTTTAVPTEVDVCVVYPYYGQTTTRVHVTSPAHTTAQSADATRNLIAATKEVGDTGPQN